MTVYLLDTMIVSESGKPRRSAQVGTWLASLDDSQIRISAVTFAEIERGISRLPPSPKKDRLRIWFDHQVPQAFAGRIFDFDSACARTWGAMAAAAGRTLPSRDAMIAATALTHGLIVATRNVRDFARMNVPTFDPWSS